VISVVSGRKDHNLDRCIMYDLCVIGAGCIGSAAARHASQWGRVCLIGPKEPGVSML
jgi:pyruvate/2-oxoglutarate dehydrogenase complex dihydrolipoamide dehydrogenase (E3) component